jgi:osmotically-inducible protein OsmY
MIRGLLRFVLLVVVLVAVVVFVAGYWPGWSSGSRSGRDGVGTSGRSGPIDPDRARARGAEAGEAIAEGANKVSAAASAAAERGGELLGDASVTARIKSKFALDESVRALAIDVDTVNGVVTLSGRVDSEAARHRAVQLAKETSGVTSVQDKLQVR